MEDRRREGQVAGHPRPAVAAARRPPAGPAQVAARILRRMGGGEPQTGRAGEAGRPPAPDHRGPAPPRGREGTAGREPPPASGPGRHCRARQVGRAPSREDREARQGPAEGGHPPGPVHDRVLGADHGGPRVAPPRPAPVGLRAGVRPRDRPAAPGHRPRQRLPDARCRRACRDPGTGARPRREAGLGRTRVPARHQAVGEPPPLAHRAGRPRAGVRRSGGRRGDRVGGARRAAPGDPRPPRAAHRRAQHALRSAGRRARPRADDPRRPRRGRRRPGHGLQRVRGLPARARHHGRGAAAAARRRVCVRGGQAGVRVRPVARRTRQGARASPTA